MQQAVCPLCGEMTSLEPRAQAQVTCPHCGGALEAVMNGRAVILKAAGPPRPEESPQALALVEKAQGESDPVKRYALLNQAAQAYPDSLAVHKALLYHGRLHQRNPKRIDFSVIKCYLLHPFEEPEAHSEAERQAYIQELFAGPELERCLSLAPDGEAFMAEYLQEISRQYIELFLRGSSRHMRSILGFPLGKADKLLAEPAARMLRQMRGDRLLSSRQQEQLFQAFYEAFKQTVGHTAFLDAAL